jgi:hypothetical protein
MIPPRTRRSSGIRVVVSVVSLIQHETCQTVTQPGTAGITVPDWPEPANLQERPINLQNGRSYSMQDPTDWPGPPTDRYRESGV